MSLPSDRGRGTSSVHDDYTIFEMEKKDINKRVLYADKIDRATFDSLLESTKKEIKAKREAVEAALKTVEANLAETNSDRYYHNDEAKSKIKKLNDIYGDLIAVENAINNMSEEDIDAKINEYNNALPQLKKGAELKLLRDQAEKINKEYKKVDTSSEEEWWNSDPYSYIEDTKDNMYQIKHTYEWLYYDEENYMSKYNHRREKHEYINYWGIVKNGPWDGCPWNIMDDDINTLKSKITGLGYELDYNEADIVHM